MTFLFILQFVLIVVLTVWYFYKKVRYAVHMFQLNSYRNERLSKWMSDNPRKIWLGRELYPAIALAPLLIWNSWIPGLIAAMFCLFLIYVFPVFKEKKALVVTQRVKRLFRTASICYFLLFIPAFSFIALQRLDFAILLLSLPLTCTFLIFPFIKLVNRLNSPLEERINKGFLNSAHTKVTTQDDLKVIGITGSFGKTSVKYFLHEILSHKYNTLMTPGSFNTTMGVTRVINESLSPLHEVFIAEMGAKHPGDIKEIVDLVKPTIGILTAVGPAHLEMFKTIENIKNTKFELINGLPADGTAFLNYDNTYIKNEIPKLSLKRIVSYSAKSKDADCFASDLKMDSRGSTFTIHFPETGNQRESIEVSTKLLGEHNVLNIVGAAAVAYQLKVSIKQIAGAVRNLKPSPHRLEVKKTAGGLTILDDAFNSNPVGSKAALEVLKLMDGDVKYLVTPGMIELGDKEYEYNFKFGQYAAINADYIILVGKKQTLPIQEGLKEAGFDEAKLFIASDFFEGNAHLQSLVKSGDVVLYENDLPDTYNEV